MSGIKSICVSAALLVYVITVRSQIPEMVRIPGGQFAMGDHSGLGGNDPNHPSDEVPIHTVSIDTFFMGRYEVTNAEYCAFLNEAFSKKTIAIQNGVVFPTGGTDTLFKTTTASPYSRIQFDGSNFSVLTNKEKHPVTDIRWFGGIAYCNWLSGQKGLDVCYTTSTGVCDFTKKGFRLPTEAEWEYAAYGGKNNPYPIFPWGDDKNTTGTFANWEKSGDPYETGDMPWTTPVGFYDGSLHQKSDFNWPGTATSYQTSNGSNGYGLYDMSGNAWELCNDWYENPYYSKSPTNNPPGPEEKDASKMPDGKVYRLMRGGNWFNGFELWGHSRCANRNPSYFRGPQDPIHPWYHVGIRVVTRQDVTTGISHDVAGHNESSSGIFIKNYTNLGSRKVEIRFYLALSQITDISLYTVSGQRVCSILHKQVPAGWHKITWDSKTPWGKPVRAGVYFCQLRSDEYTGSIRLHIIK